MVSMGSWVRLLKKIDGNIDVEVCRDLNIKERKGVAVGAIGYVNGFDEAGKACFENNGCNVVS